MNLTSTAEKTWYEQLWEDYSYHKTALLLLYILFGTAANSVVLVAYGKDKKLTGRVFILCLAIIDVTACLFFLPQVPMYIIHVRFHSESLNIFRGIYHIESVVLIQSYMFAQVAMSLDQYVAVYFPFKHRKVAPKMKKIMLAVSMCMIGAVSSNAVLSRSTKLINFRAWDLATFAVHLLEMFLSFLTLLIIYPMIVVKLYRQHRKVGPPKANDVNSRVVVSTTNRATGQRTATVQLPTGELLQASPEPRQPPTKAQIALTTTGKGDKNMTAASAESSDRSTTYAATVGTGREPETGKEPPTGREPPRSAATNLTRQDQDKIQSKTARKMHVQAIKIYTSIFLLFTLSLVSLLIIIESNNPSWTYAYFLNHIGNPIIYYVFAPKFREKVNTYCRRLRCW